MAIRKQFHFRPSQRGYFAWNVERLIALTRSLPIHKVPLTSITDLDEPYWYGSNKEIPSVRSIAEHAQLIEEADMNFPIILSSDGRVMDGMHRVARALMNGSQTIDAVRFAQDPEPDFVDVLPEDLDYS